MQLRLLLLLTSALLFVAASLYAQNISPYWSTAGNSNATSSSKLGTTNGIPLRLMTKNLERMRIDTIGRVYIGSSTATSRLVVNASAGTSPFTAQVNGSTKLYAGSTGGLSIGSGATPPANGLYVAGNMGIGTNSPSGKLHVVGNEILTGSLSIGVTTPELGYKMHIVGGGIKIYREWGTGDEEGNNYGIYADGHTGVYGNGVIGIRGNGMRGVFGTGLTGVYGEGATFGVEGYNSGEDGGYGGNFESIYGTGLVATTTEGTYAAAFYGKVYMSNGYTTSDKNLKQNIREFSGAMAIINKLKPQNYEFKTEAKYASLNLPKGSHYGLMAQDLEEVLPNLVSEAPHELRNKKGVEAIKPTAAGKPASVGADVKETITIKAVNYTELIPVMVKGMQELSSKDNEIDALKEQVANQQQQITELRQMLLELKNGRTGSVNVTSAYLEQNTPNPASGTTTIRYHIPEQSTSAHLILTNAKGQVVKTVSLNNRGVGQVNLATSMLAAGTYTYSLWVDGKQADTKRLVIAR